MVPKCFFAFVISFIDGIYQEISSAQDETTFHQTMITFLDCTMHCPTRRKTPKLLTVRFDEVVLVKLITHCRDYTDQERKSAWYTLRDFKRFLADSRFDRRWAVSRQTSKASLPSMPRRQILDRHNYPTRRPLETRRTNCVRSIGEDPRLVHDQHSS